MATKQEFRYTGETPTQSFQDLPRKYNPQKAKIQLRKNNTILNSLMERIILLGVVSVWNQTFMNHIILILIILNQSVVVVK